MLKSKSAAVPAAMHRAAGRQSKITAATCPKNDRIRGLLFTPKKQTPSCHRHQRRHPTTLVVFCTSIRRGVNTTFRHPPTRKMTRPHPAPHLFGRPPRPTEHRAGLQPQPARLLNWPSHRQESKRLAGASHLKKSPGRRMIVSVSSVVNPSVNRNGPHLRRRHRHRTD